MIHFGKSSSLRDKLWLSTSQSLVSAALCDYFAFWAWTMCADRQQPHLHWVQGHGRAKAFLSVQSLSKCSVFNAAVASPTSQGDNMKITESGSAWYCRSRQMGGRLIMLTQALESWGLLYITWFTSVWMGLSGMKCDTTNEKGYKSQNCHHTDSHLDQYLNVIWVTLLTWTELHEASKLCNTTQTNLFNAKPDNPNLWYNLLLLVGNYSNVLQA